MLIGAKIEELEALSQSFGRYAQEVERFTSSLGGELGNAYWEGPFAEQFRGLWADQYHPTLQRLAEGLHEAGREVLAAARRLEDAG